MLNRHDSDEKKQRHSQFDIPANALEIVLPSSLALAPGTELDLRKI